MVMDMWARVDKGVVLEITNIDPHGRFNPSIEWIICGESVCEGWSYDGKTFKNSETPKNVVDIGVVRDARKLAYSNPIYGSDCLFSEASRMKEMGEEGWNTVKERAVERFLEIQRNHPWPE